MTDTTDRRCLLRQRLPRAVRRIPDDGRRADRAWCGVFLGDLVRRRTYADADLYDARGRYGSIRPIPLARLVIGTAVGWELVTKSTGTSWLQWQGFLLRPVGLGDATGSWAGAGLGVLVALVIGFVGSVLSTASRPNRRYARDVTVSPQHRDLR
ncbi:hypothetical protein [Rudaeicoccus suwonensis]|uniref:hypothetical protein n=1 Tax=Rudaeicoccus suwonensis TaxID=657409 RepID=UPI0011A9E5DF|nr:hypothetical protein [Rudaeicoccus suwonensis]